MFDRPVVDSVGFAREARQLRGEVPVAGLQRLREAVADDTGVLRYAVAGFINDLGKPALELSVSGELTLLCQRCLGPVDLRLETRRAFELVPQDAPLGDPADEADDVDQIYADPKLDVIQLVEDEAILSLPMVASHAAGQCEAPQAGAADTSARSPFSKLSTLKRQ
jgi:uncharacterized protein